MNPDKIFLKATAFLKAALYILCIVTGVFGILFILRNAVNALFLYNYGNGNYSTVAEYTMASLPFEENYVLYYNLGNAEYQKGNYEKAIVYYTQALSADLPEHVAASSQKGTDSPEPDSDSLKRAPLHDEECRIRLNLAFTICHTVDFDRLDLNDQEAVMQAVTVLLQARYILTECGCASEPVGSNDGHYRNADKLKHDIDKMLQLLQARSESDSDGQGNGGQDESRDQDEGQSGDSGSDQEQEDASDQSQGQTSDKEEREAERARQEDLKEELKQQKEDLKTGSESPSSYEYEYLDGGDAQGYGDGTLW